MMPSNSISAVTPKFIRTACLILALSLSNTAFSSAPHNVYLTATESDGIPLQQPATEFSCSDKIYAVIELSGLSREMHKLDAVWRDPHGKDREFTEYEFQASNESERIWVWLKLHRPAEAALVSFINPSAGMDEFIGKWELHLAIDNEPLETKSFSVLC
jgi:hypothetical protein